jgi:3-hydroxyisobutyrate dehydrogenase
MTGTGAGKPSQGEKLGYLGLGMMGIPMARRLIDAGYEITVWNRSSGKAKALVEAGAKLAVDPRKVAESASVIFMCVTDAAAVEDVVFGANGLAEVSGAGKLVVDFSSIHPDAAHAIAWRGRRCARNLQAFRSKGSLTLDKGPGRPRHHPRDSDCGHLKDG